MVNKIKLGIVGLGRAGYGMHVHELQDFLDMYEIYAVCDIIEERRNKVAAESGAKAYADYAEMLKDPEIEVVAIATRSSDHYEHAMMALKAGKVVFLDKPMCTTYEEALDLVSYAKSLGENKLFIRLNRRFEGMFNKVYDIINSGILGDVFSVTIRRNWFQFRNDWQTSKQYGGGMLNNWGPHIIDHTMKFCGGSYTDVMADRRLVNSCGDCEDVIKAFFKGENGRIVDVEISNACALPQAIYSACGTRGTLKEEGGKLKLKYIKPDIKKVKPVQDLSYGLGAYTINNNIEWVEETVSPYYSPLNETYKCVYEALRENKPYPITLDESIEIMRAINDIRLMSTVTDHWVD